MIKTIGSFVQLLVGSKDIESAQVLEPPSGARVGKQRIASFMEMRQATRLSLSIPVSYRVKGALDKWHFTTSQDYSSSGIRLVLLSVVRPGMDIELNIKLPEVDHAIHMRGVVVWVAQTSHRHAQHRVVECGIVFDPIQKTSHRQKLVYLIANKLCRLGLKSTQHLIAAPVQTLVDLKACYSMVYQGYLARGYCSPHPSKMYYHYFSFLPESRTFMLKDQDTLLGTISVIVDSPCGLPMDNLFSREINRLRNPGRKLAEVSLLSMAHHDKGKKMFSLTNFDKQVQLFRLFKIVYEYARHIAGVTDLVIGVHPKHEALYKYLMFNTMGSSKSYKEACGNPALPLHLDIIQCEQHCSSYLQDYFMRERTAPEIIRSGVVMRDEIVRQFLFEEQVLWLNMPLKAREYFKQCYSESDLDTWVLRKRVMG